jgi:alpha-amylase
MLPPVHAAACALDSLESELKLQREVLGPEVLPLLGNFLDNHDFPRFLELQPDHALFKNGLAWVLLAEGIPVVYYGSASGMRGGTDGNRHRQCLWSQPYDTHSDLYRMIGTLSK